MKLRRKNYSLCYVLAKLGGNSRSKKRSSKTPKTPRPISPSYNVHFWAPGTHFRSCCDGHFQAVCDGHFRAPGTPFRSCLDGDFPAVVTFCGVVVTVNFQLLGRSFLRCLGRLYSSCCDGHFRAAGRPFCSCCDGHFRAPGMPFWSCSGVAAKPAREVVKIKKIEVWQWVKLSCLIFQTFSDDISKLYDRTTNKYFVLDVTDDFIMISSFSYMFSQKLLVRRSAQSLVDHYWSYLNNWISLKRRWIQGQKKWG